MKINQTPHLVWTTVVLVQAKKITVTLKSWSFRHQWRQIEKRRGKRRTSRNRRDWWVKVLQLKNGVYFAGPSFEDGTNSCGQQSDASHWDPVCWVLFFYSPTSGTRNRFAWNAAEMDEKVSDASIWKVFLDGFKEVLSLLMLCAPSNRRWPFSNHAKMVNFGYSRVLSVFSLKKTWHKLR